MASTENGLHLDSVVAVSLKRGLGPGISRGPSFDASLCCGLGVGTAALVVFSLWVPPVGSKAPFEIQPLSAGD